MVRKSQEYNNTERTKPSQIESQDFVRSRQDPAGPQSSPALSGEIPTEDTKLTYVECGESGYVYVCGSVPPLLT